MARLDTELVRRGLARARGQAGELVATGRVLVDGHVAHKSAQNVHEDTRLELLAGPGPHYVGRGAHKLAGVLDELEASYPPGVAVDGMRCVDAGSSTGGFTQVLLERGARHVLAVDVGHDQLAPALREDPRVLDLSGTTVRGLTPSAIGGPVDLVVADLSFISLSLVLADLRCLVRPTGQLVLLVKPQFEVGRERLGSGGVVRDPGLRAEAVRRVCTVGVQQRLAVRAVRGQPVARPQRQRRVLRLVHAAAGPDGPVGEPGDLDGRVLGASCSRAGKTSSSCCHHRRGADRVRGPCRRRGGTRVSRRVLLVTHTGRPEAVTAAHEVLAGLRDAGLEVALLPDEADALSPDATAGPPLPVARCGRAGRPAGPGRRQRARGGPRRRRHDPAGGRAGSRDRRAVARGEPRPRRVPRRDRAGGPRTRRSSGSSTATTPSRSG